MIWLLVTSATMSAVVLFDIARVETLRVAVYPRPLLPHLRRYGSISLKLYRHIDYGWPAIISVYVSALYNRHIKIRGSRR